MNKINEKKKVLTLVDIINKNKKKNKNFRGSCYLKNYDGQIDFKRCEEEFFFDLTDRYPDVFDDKKETKMSETIEAMHRLLYETVLVRTDDGLLPLKSKEVQNALNVDQTKPDKIVNTVVKSLLPSLEDRSKLFSSILEFSGFGSKAKENKAKEIKN